MLENILTSILGAIIGGFIGAWAGRKNVEKSYELACNEKVIRLQNQVKYLADLYNNNLKVFHDSDRRQEDINSAIWEPDIFIFETDYKSDLSYTKLTSYEKQKILSWFHQWEIIDRKITDYLQENDYSAIVAESILEKKCIKQREQLERLLPDIKLIIQKLNP